MNKQMHTKNIYIIERIGLFTRRWAVIIMHSFLYAYVCSARLLKIEFGENRQRMGRPYSVEG